MIRLIEALNFVCLRDVRQELAGFQILVGANASGKSSFLDVISLMSDLLRDGLVAAIREKRAPDIQDLVWMRQPGKHLEVAVELAIPAERRSRLPQNGYDRARYELSIGHDRQGQLAILAETLWLVNHALIKRSFNFSTARQLEFFPAPREPRPNLVLPERKKSPPGWRKVVSKKSESGNDYFSSETTGWNSPFRLGAQRLALANLPEDEDKFPVATWVKRVLMDGVRLLVLNSLKMRRPSPPGSPLEFQPDGSNLPWAVEDLRTRGDRFQFWLDHVRTALPDIETIDTVQREEDKHRYLRIKYRNGLEAKSWTLSDGTLRLLALTLLGYLEPADRVYLIEEPENGIHPGALETVFQSLSSRQGDQILCATHSPIFLSLAEPEQVLCFARDSNGATDVVRGSEHPNLRDWKRETDLGTLLASGILG